MGPAARASVVIGLVLAMLGCRRDDLPREPGGTPDLAPPAGTSSTAPLPRASSDPTTPSSAEAAAEPRSRAFELTVASGNPTPAGAPNVWAYVPAAYRRDRPLSLVFVFHGFENCLRSLVGAVGAPCRPGGPARTSLDLAAQIDRSGTGAVTIVPQLAWDAKSGDPGVLGSGAALERLAKEVIEGPLSSALGGRTVDEVERVAAIAISGGFQALFATASAFPGKLRDLYLLDAYYVENGPVDAFLFRNLGDFAQDAARPRHLGVVHSALRTTTEPAEGLARRAETALRNAGLAGSFLHRREPADVTARELAVPVAILRSDRDHDAIPRTDVEKALVGCGI